MTARQFGLALIAIMTGMAIAVLATARAPAGEQRRFWDAQGRSVGTASTDSQGTTTFYDAHGRVVGRAGGNEQATRTAGGRLSR